MQTGSGETTLTAVLRLRDEMSPQLEKSKSALAGMPVGFDILKKAATKAMAIITGSLILMTKSVMSTADELDKMNRQTGVSVETLQKLAFVAAESGASLQDIGSGMKFLGRSLAAAKNGGQEAIEAFRLLGVGIEELKAPGMTTEKLFMRIADSMQFLSDEQRQEVFKVMGRGAADLIPLLSQGSAAITALGDAAKETGAIMSGEAVKALDSFGDQLTGMGMALKGMWGELLASQTVSLPKIIEGFGVFMVAISDVKGKFVLAFKTVQNALTFAAVVIKATFNAIVDTIQISMAKAVDAIRTPLMLLARGLNKAGLMADETLAKMQVAFDGFGAVAQKSLKDPFANLGVTIKQEYAVAMQAQGEFVDEMKADYKAAVDSVDIFTGRLKQAAALQTDMGRDKAVKQAKTKSDPLDEILAMAKALNIVTTEQKKLNQMADDFAKKSGIRLNAEQMKMLADAAAKGDAAVQQLFEDITKATEADPLKGMQLALWDLTQRTYSFRDAWGKIFEDLRSGFSETFANAIDGTEKFGDGFKKVMKDLKRNLIKMFTDFATNQLFGAAGGLFGSVFGASSPAAPGTGVGQPGTTPGMSGMGGQIGGLASGIGSALGMSGGTFGAVAGLGAAGAALTVSGVSNGNVTQGTMGGALAGMATGAVIGSVIPGIGTVIGGVVGAIVGGLAGFLGSSAKKKKKAREAARKAAAALAAYNEALSKARVVLKGDIRNKLGGGLATEEAAADIGHLFSEDLSADEIMKFGDPAAIAAKEAAVDRQNNINAPITVNATITGSYDAQRLAEDLSYHLQNQMGGAAGGL